MLGVPFRVQPASVTETRGPGESPPAYVERLAREKAAATATRAPGAWVLGGDTTVALEDRILEKPGSADEAVRMLLDLAGRTHDVFTALALVGPGGACRSRVDRSRVRFRPFEPEEAAAYVATGEPMDKAGAYGIQGKGAALVESVEGDFFTVMGLSVAGLVSLLAEVGRPYRFEGAPGESPFRRVGTG